MKLLQRLSSALREVQPEPDFLIENASFRTAWLGPDDELSESVKAQVRAATDAAQWIATYVRVQLGASGAVEPADWKGIEVFVLGYVGGLAFEWARKIDEPKAEFQIFVSLTALCFIYGKGVTGQELLERFMKHRFPDDVQYSQGAEAAARDFNLPRGVVPSTIMARQLNILPGEA